MGDLTHRRPGDRALWDRLRHQAGFGSDHDSQSSTKNTTADEATPGAPDAKATLDWIEHNPDKRKALSNAKDHLYNLIDDPNRDNNKAALFGVAKNFPETTRPGYRAYLEEKLRQKAGEEGRISNLLNLDRWHGKHSDDTKASTPPEGGENGSQPPPKHQHRTLFTTGDYSMVHRVRAYLHAELAEFLGIFVLMTVGLSATMQSKVGGQEYSTYTTVVLSWGIANMLGIYVAGGYSGAHLNPVVTLTLWFYRGFPFQRVFTYWMAQFFGAMAGTAWVFILYYPALKELDPDGWSMKTGSYFFVMPNPKVPIATAWFNEVTATAIIHIVIFAVGDSHNVSPARGMNALVLGFAVIAIGSSFGYLTPFGLNPVRDFGPRIFLSMVGFPKQLWTAKDWFWIVGEWTGPFLGGIIGAGAYDLFIFDGPESPINFPRKVKIRSLEVFVESVLHPIRRHRERVADEEELAQAPVDRTLQNVGQPAQ